MIYGNRFMRHLRMSAVANIHLSGLAANSNTCRSNSSVNASTQTRRSILVMALDRFQLGLDGRVILNVHRRSRDISSS